MTDWEVLHLLVLLCVLLAVAHVFGALAERLRQPRMAGELVGGLMLGPTFFGWLAPGAQSSFFPHTGAVASCLAAVQNLGLLMLMFLAGAEIRRLVPRDNRRVTGWLVLVGLAVPFGLGIGLLRLVDLTRFMGTAGDELALTLVVASAIAVTSIPVISRIMLDLDIINTRFARVVLAAAVAEDVVLYVVIAVALGIAHSPGHGLTGLPGAWGLTSVPAVSAYYVVATLTLLGCMMTVVPAVTGRLLRGRRARFTPTSATILSVLLILGCAAGAALLGVETMFGGFLAGILVGRIEETQGTRIADNCRPFAFAFFLPVYFATVGLSLDLRRNLLVGFTVAALLVACAAKIASVFLAGRISGQSNGSSLNLAFAMNARGGPGIVLATLAVGAGIVNRQLYTTLIVLAVLTSLLAGAWLRRARDRGMLLDFQVQRLPEPDLAAD
jgi:K+:H+ antiporter